MIINIDEIYERLTDNDDWEPIEFENHRNEVLVFEQIATIEYEGKNYAYMYEIDENGEHVIEFPAVVLLEEKDGERSIDFVTDKNLISNIAYEILKMRGSESDDGDDMDELDGNDEFYDEDELPEDAFLDENED